ncbi:MAG: EamA family transporter [Candidatus Dojkabacteria bacterium]|nr:EamA family transporter [Candidatus Dojkabacteria bacterium]
MRNSRTTLLLFFADPFDVEFKNAILLILFGMISIFQLIPYFKSLSYGETSILIVMTQSLPIYSFFLAYIFLGETLSPRQIFGGIIILIGTLSFAIDFRERSFRAPIKGVLLMLFATFLAAAHTTAFKYVALEEDLWKTTFWEYIGYLIFALGVLFISRETREKVFSFSSSSDRNLIGINIFNEVVNLVAWLTFHAAALAAPLSIAWLINGTHPVFMFIAGILLTTFLPRLISERIDKGTLLHKSFFIVVILVGFVILNPGSI